MTPRTSTTQHLLAHVAGDPTAGERMTPTVYAQLHAIAARLFEGERSSHTLQPTAVVHEAYLRLVDVEVVSAHGERSFLALAATVLRNVLVDHARSRSRLRRGGGGHRVPMVDSEDGAMPAVEVLALHESLERLAQVHARPAKVVELRMFGGLAVKEVAAELGVSERAIVDDWRLARAWLSRDMSRGGEGHGSV